jgi:hypothetical protein
LRTSNPSASLAEVLPWFTSATEDVLIPFTGAGHSIYWVTVGPAGLLYTLAAFVVAHKVLNGCDCIGLRVGCVSGRQLGVMEAVVQEHTSLARPSSEMEALVAHLRTQADKLTAAAQNNVAPAAVNAAQAAESQDAPRAPWGKSRSRLRETTRRRRATTKEGNRRPSTWWPTTRCNHNCSLGPPSTTPTWARW